MVPECIAMSLFSLVSTYSLGHMVILYPITSRLITSNFSILWHQTVLSYSDYNPYIPLYSHYTLMIFQLYPRDIPQRPVIHVILCSHYISIFHSTKPSCQSSFPMILLLQPLYIYVYIYICITIFRLFS